MYYKCNFPLTHVFCSSSARGDGRVPLIRCTPSFPNGLFSHHSNRDNSLQDYPSFAGETVGTRIERDISLIMPPSFVRRLCNNMAQSDGTIRQARRSNSRRLATRVPSLKLHIPFIRTPQYKPPYCDKEQERHSLKQNPTY